MMENCWSLRSPQEFWKSEETYKKLGFQQDYWSYKIQLRSMHISNILYEIESCFEQKSMFV